MASSGDAAQWLPGCSEGICESILDLSHALIWHPDSIVASGVESFFVDFGWFAIALYPLVSYLLAWKFPLRIVTTPMSPKVKLMCYTTAGWTIMFVHGALAVWIAFTFINSMIILLFWPFFRRHIRVKTPNSIEGERGYVEPGIP